MENQEVINYLLAYNDLKIIQRKDMFNFSLDTVLLSQFCTINKDVKNIVDWCNERHIGFYLVQIMRLFHYCFQKEHLKKL